jgi:DNA replication protein DnaC
MQQSDTASLEQQVETTLQHIETMRLDPGVCSTCKRPIEDTAHGWVKLYGDHTCTEGHHKKYGYCEIPCPMCSGGVQARVWARQKAATLAHLFGGANIPWHFKDWTFASFPSNADQQAMEQVKNWLSDMLRGDDSRKRGLYLQGEFGVGKTSLAISALKEILHASQPGLFVTATELLIRIRACYHKDAPFAEDEVLRALTETPYVVLDDLGAEKPSEDAVKQLYYIFNTRLSKGLCTIITSNRPVTVGNDCLEVYWQAKANLNARRAIERLLQHCQGIAVAGKNLRAK